MFSIIVCASSIISVIILFIVSIGEKYDGSTERLNLPFAIFHNILKPSVIGLWKLKDAKL